MRHFAVLLVFVCAHPLGTFPQAGAKWTFAKFNQTLTDASFKVPVSSPEDQTISSSSKSLDEIRSAYLAKYGNNADTESQIVQNLTPEYSRSMVDDLQMLNPLPTERSARLAALEEVRDDLAIKAKAISSSSPLTATVFPSIVRLNLTVTISAKDSLNPSLISIRANPHHFGAKSPAAYILGSGTDTQSARLPPGRFWIWVEANGRIIQAQERDIGSNGETADDVKFTLN